jgi:hypothetical protein
VTERIIAIKELSGYKPDSETSQCSWASFDGYEVTTTAQTIRLLMYMGDQCCEKYGYFLSQDDFAEFIGAELRGVTLTDTALETSEVQLAAELGKEEYRLDDGDVMFVNIETDRGVLQFTAYNRHNGYYGHTARVESQQLTHEEML